MGTTHPFLTNLSLVMSLVSLLVSFLQVQTGSFVPCLCVLIFKSVDYLSFLQLEPTNYQAALTDIHCFSFVLQNPQFVFATYEWPWQMPGYLHINTAYRTRKCNILLTITLKQTCSVFLQSTVINQVCHLLVLLILDSQSHYIQFAQKS